MFSPKSSLLQSPANSNEDTGANIDASVVSPNNRETEVSVENLNEIIPSQVFSHPSTQNNPVNPDLAHQALDNNLLQTVLTMPRHPHPRIISMLCSRKMSLITSKL